MHEWGIATGILEKVTEAAREHHLATITKVEVNLGTGLGIAEEEFVYCLRTITKKEGIFKHCQFVVKLVTSNLASIEAIEGDVEAEKGTENSCCNESKEKTCGSNKS